MPAAARPQNGPDGRPGRQAAVNLGHMPDGSPRHFRDKGPFNMRPDVKNFAETNEQIKHAGSQPWHVVMNVMLMF